MSVAKSPSIKLPPSGDATSVLVHRLKPLSFSRWWAVLMLSLAVGITQIVAQPLATPTPVAAARELVLLEPAPIPIRRNPDSFEPNITATSALVIDMPSGSWLFTKDPEQLVRPASTTKLLSALVARQSLDLDQVLTVKEEAFTQGTTMGLELGEQISVRNLLAGLLITSGNDAAFVLAQAHPGGYAGFVTAMNEEATNLGLSLSHFNNPSGLDEDNHRSTARDMSVVARKVMMDPVLRDVAGRGSFTVSDITGETSHLLQHTHDLVGVEPGVVGIKTGTTPLAGEVLITEWERNGQDILILVFNSQDRYQDTRTLMDWAMSEYEWRVVNTTTTENP